MPRTDSLSLAQARRITLGAQGFGERRPTGRIDRRHLRKVFDRIGLVLKGEHQWSGMRRLEAEHGRLIEALYTEVMARGPASAGDLDATGRKKGSWWGWGDTKRALEHLFHEGRVGAVRRSSFERAYCDPDLTVPLRVRRRPTPPSRDAMVELLVHAARSHGVGTAKDLADYFRLPIPVVRPLLEEMADDGAVDRVTVEHWKQPTYTHPEVNLPRRIDACALVSPFDSIMWERDRIERLFGFRYRIEIYVPKPKRVFGYYVLPFLLGDRYVARVDLKADRAGSTLLVQSAFAEAGVDHAEVAERLIGELRTMAVWLGLDDVVVNDRGDLAAALRAAAV